MTDWSHVLRPEYWSREHEKPSFPALSTDMSPEIQTSHEMQGELLIVSIFFFSFFFGGKAGTGWRIITKTNLRMTRLKRDSCNCPSLSRKDKKGQNYTLGEKPCNLTVCYRACQRKAAANMPRFLPTALQNCECVYLHRTFFSCLQQRVEPEDPATC